MPLQRLIIDDYCWVGEWRCAVYRYHTYRGSVVTYCDMANMFYASRLFCHRASLWFF